MINLNRYKKIINNFRNNLEDISENIEYFLEKTINLGQDFGGPSVYFHNKALEKQKLNFLKTDHLEMIYAVMPSWGMHRMGSKGAKMVDYITFQNEIIKNEKLILELKKENYKTVDKNIIVNLIINKIHVSTSNSYLVSSAKVLHHILPQLISPIDRNYSIRFMRQNKDSFGKDPISINNEEAYAFIFLQEMYNFLLKNETKMLKYLESNKDNLYNKFNTSITKIFDNLIMAYVKEYKGAIFNED